MSPVTVILVVWRLRLDVCTTSEFTRLSGKISLMLRLFDVVKFHTM